MSELAGDLVKRLTPAEVNARSAAGTSHARPGQHVTLWRLGGRWSVWSVGHTTGHRWLLPADPEAVTLRDVALDETQRARVYPVIERAAMGAVEVRNREIRTTAARAEG